MPAASRVSRVTPAEILTSVLAIIAIVISSISLIWNIRRASWDRPKVEVSGRAGVGASSDCPNDPYWELSISVANTGERSVTVQDGSWLVQPAEGRSIRWGSSDPEFPFRLEPHDSRDWTIKVPLLGTTLTEVRGRPAVHIVQRPTWLERRRGLGPTRWVYGPFDSVRRPSGEKWESWLRGGKR